MILERTRANLYSVDYSTAVEANWRNNGALGDGRFVLAQASIYDMPFPDGRFDKVLCLGVLQHTPDFEASVRALVGKARPGGEIARCGQDPVWRELLGPHRVAHPAREEVAPESTVALALRQHDIDKVLSQILDRGFRLGGRGVQSRSERRDARVIGRRRGRHGFIVVFLQLSDRRGD